MQPCLTISMSTAHTPVTSNSTNSPSNTIRTHTKRYSIGSQQIGKKDQIRGSPRSQSHTLLVELENRKRRLAMEEASANQQRRTSQSPPLKRAADTHRDDERLTPNSRSAKLAAIAGDSNGSPRTQLPSFTNLTSGVVPEEDGHASGENDIEVQIKRRRLEGGDGSRPGTRESGGAFSSPHQEYEEDEERLLRKELRQQDTRYSNGHIRDHSDELKSMGAPLLRGVAVTDPRHASLIEEGYDSNVPLARRRGDLAQAKAGRLHIDTGSVDTGVVGGGSGISGGFESNTANRFKSISSSGGVGGLGAKSAPPYKMTFTDRDREGGQQFDSRGEPPPLSSQQGSRHYVNGSGAASQSYNSSNTYATRREIPSQEMHNFNDANGHSRRIEQYAPTTSSQQQSALGGGSILHRQLANAAGATPTTGNPPLSAVRGNIFVPQTATLPSPAYHTTQFMRNPMGPSQGANGGDLRGASNAGVVGSNNPGGPPKTAGLNPPMTARLPEHLRSPPSSKTQFLSLFSNFYDSLTDSRTLKATLEDQVRRSNTLLQTLQKSSRVLELTVDRRVREERILWESRVRNLEDRCKRLERQFGGSDREGDEEINPETTRVSATSKDSSTKRNSLKDDEEKHDSILHNGSVKSASISGGGVATSVNGSESRDEPMVEAE